MDLKTKREADKQELTLDTNSFEKPKTLNGVTAWCQQILNLIYLDPGTYPSLPEMGVGIQQYQYDFTDTAVDKLKTSINTQVEKYLPDIPIGGIEVRVVPYKGQQVLLIAFSLINEDGLPVNEAIAINTSNGYNGRKFIDFEVTWR